MNIDGYGPLGHDHPGIPRELGEWVAVELGVEPGTLCVQNRGSRIKVMVPEIDRQRLVEALGRTGLILDEQPSGAPALK